MNKRGRPRVGAPISITITDEQRAWLEGKIPPGGTLTATVRAILQREVDNEKSNTASVHVELLRVDPE